MIALTSLAALLSAGCTSESKPAKDNTTAPVDKAPKVVNAPPAEHKAHGVVKPASEIVYTEMAPFVKFGPAKDNMKVGAHGTFGLFPGKASSPPHTHSGAYHAVVIEGVMENPFGNEKNPAKLAAGSHWYVPASEQHVTRCVSEEPCRFYFHADGKFDFAPVDALSTSRSAEAASDTADSLKWEQVAPFVKMAAAWGDKGTGAHGTFGRFPAKASSPKHTHSGDYQAVVIQGTMTNPFGDQADPPEMGPGSFWEVKAGAPHVTSCISDTPCLFYFHSNTKFDFAPAE